MSYKIIRCYSPRIGKRTHAVRGMRGLTLEEAQAHCQRDDSHGYCVGGKIVRQRYHNGYSDTLVGFRRVAGTRYSVESDPDTGEEKKTKIPVDWFDGYEEE